MRVAQVVLDVSAAELEDAYTYAVPDGMELSRGDGLLVPFGPRTVVGFVESLSDADERDFDYKLRPISERIEGVALPEQILNLVDYIADEFATTTGSAFTAAIPPGLRTRLSAYYAYKGGEPTTPSQAAIIGALAKRGKLSEKAVKALSGYTESALKALLSLGAVAKSVGLPQDRKRGPREIVLADESSAKQFIAEQGNRRPAQAQCLAALIEAPRTGLTVAEVSVLAGVSEQTVKALVEAGLLVPSIAETEPARKTSGHRLNANQTVALNAITSALKSAQHHKFLLFGVTGSGKTEVYLRAISETLSLGKQALFLVPEIALTAQVVGQLKARFGPSVAVMHSGLATGERLRNWRRAATGEAPVVVGARSAIFAPLTNLGIIVIDEEHDSSYKQESTPRYDVRALAERRAQSCGAVLLAGSATPSISTFYRTTTGEIDLLRLPVRAATSSLPEVHIEDLREAYKSKKPSMLSERLRKELAVTISQGEQAMLFINRRAFARSLLCRDCGFKPSCPRCSVALTFHSRPLHLRCHHCDFREKVEDRCPSCKSLRIRPLGIGTQKVEDFVRKEFPGMKVERLDRDVASRRGAVEEIFARVRSGETQTLIGTQMIAKGLDFENVTLVGVIAADIGLSIPDYRSTERTFQLLTQVAGRAGRRKPGRVVIQSFTPDHPSTRLAAAQDFESFFAEEIVERQDALYPPFVRLVNVIVSGLDRAMVHSAASLVKIKLDDELAEKTLYGPAECALARLHGNWRAHVLVKLPLDFDMRTFPRSRDFEIARPMLVTVDVDAGSLL